mgnify:CR=1 FL=1
MTIRHYTGFWLKDAITTAACVFVAAFGLSACSDSDSEVPTESTPAATPQAQSEVDDAIGSVLNNLNQQLEKTSDQVQEAMAPHAEEIQARTKDEVEKLFKWEYKVVDMPASSTPSQMERELSELGAEGWECVSILAVPTGLRVSCKRKPPSALAYLKYIPGL